MIIQKTNLFLKIYLLENNYLIINFLFINKILLIIKVKK